MTPKEKLIRTREAILALPKTSHWRGQLNVIDNWIEDFDSMPEKKQQATLKLADYYYDVITDPRKYISYKRARWQRRDI